MPVAKLRNQVRVPLTSVFQNRDSTNAKDQRFINCYVDVFQNKLQESNKTYLVKRPGVASYSTTTSGSGRGVWYFSGSVYHATGGTLYRNNVALITLTPGFTYECGAVQILAPTEKLFFVDGINGWLISPDGSYETVEKAFYAWTASTIYEVGDKIVPTRAGWDGYYYICAVAGTSGGSEPTWASSTADGTVVWTRVTTYTGARDWEASTVYAAGSYVVPNTPNALFYKTTAGGTSAVGEPTWPTTIGQTVSDGTITWECMGYYGGFPCPHIPQPIFLDGYVFLAELNSADIYNSRVSTPTSWNASEFISADSFSDPIKAIVRYNNYIAALGKNNVELFYDGANTTGSPLTRHDSFLLQTGAAAKNAIINAESILVWVGTSDLGKKTIWLMDGFEPKEISNSAIERILEGETSPDSITGFGFRNDGHMFLMINLPTADRSIVFDVLTDQWYEWQHNDVEMPFSSHADKAGDTLLQHTDGKLYLMAKSSTVDAVGGVNVPIEMTVITPKLDFDNNYRKFYHSIDIIGDLVSTSVLFDWTDDDYQTWSQQYTVGMATRPRVAMGGSSRRRAFRIQHSAATTLRLEALQLVLTQGKN